MAREPTTTPQGYKSRMVDQRDSLAREIDEELRREQMLKLWERYGIYVIAAVVLVIAGIGGGFHEKIETGAGQPAVGFGERIGVRA